MRQAYVVRKETQLNFASSFRSVGGRVSIWTYILTLCLEGLIVIAGIIVSVILAAILGALGYAVSRIAGYPAPGPFIVMFAAPAVVIMLLYILISVLIFSPTAYIMLNNEGISAGETIGACYRSMMNNGKSTVFLTYFVSNLLRGLYWTVVAVGGYFLIRFIPNGYALWGLIGLGVISFAGYLTFAPILTLTNRVVKEHLFEDIVLDPTVAARINEKVNLSVCNGKVVDSQTVSQDLASLFEYTEDPYKILEATDRKARRLASNRLKAVKKRSADGSNANGAKRKKKVLKFAEIPQKPAADAPKAEQKPSTDAPKAPQAEVKAAETPVVEKVPPAAETPTVEIPVVEAQPVETPVVEADAVPNQPLN